jgi:predicted PolB exonuclease-like 3'-5' exonuclease
VSILKYIYVKNGELKIVYNKLQKQREKSMFEELIGDYLAVAISDIGIVCSQKSTRFISNHAGMTEQEMKFRASVPGIIIDYR